MKPGRQTPTNLDGDVPGIRVRAANDAQPAPYGRYVLYWMISARRTTWNFALDRAADWARQLHKPLFVFEALRCGYTWASDRLHRFVIEGMADNARSLGNSPAGYFPYVEPQPGAGKGLLAALAEQACVVVTDDFPAFFLPRMLAAAAKRINVRVEAVDSNGLLPLRATDREFTSAYQFRRFLQKQLAGHLEVGPQADCLRNCELPVLDRLADETQVRWPAASPEQLLRDASAIAAIPIDHAVGPAAFRGGAAAAGHALGRFVDDGLVTYLNQRNDPDADATSGLSPYLHFGHVSAHQVFDALANREKWSPDKLAAKSDGKREGWWGMSPAAESFLDQLVTWRELGFNLCAQRADYGRYESLPAWARATLEQHAADPRETIYSPEQFERAETHDQLWNAAQRQLVREGRLHNYLRMLWGKKILEWTASPQDALDVMIELNNKYAVDGRDPNSYSGIFWCLGRYDRPWGPERKVFGKVRYMSSDNTRRKVKLRGYLEEYAP